MTDTETFVEGLSKEIALTLLEAAKTHGFDADVVKATSNGFNVPTALVEAMEAETSKPEPEPEPEPEPKPESEKEDETPEPDKAEDVKEPVAPADPAVDDKVNPPKPSAATKKKESGN